MFDFQDGIWMPGQARHDEMPISFIKFIEYKNSRRPVNLLCPVKRGGLCEASVPSPATSHCGYLASGLSSVFRTEVPCRRFAERRCFCVKVKALYRATAMIAELWKQFGAVQACG